MQHKYKHIDNRFTLRYFAVLDKFDSVVFDYHTEWQCAWAHSHKKIERPKSIDHNGIINNSFARSQTVFNCALVIYIWDISSSQSSCLSKCHLIQYRCVRKQRETAGKVRKIFFGDIFWTYLEIVCTTYLYLLSCSSLRLLDIRIVLKRWQSLNHKKVKLNRKHHHWWEEFWNRSLIMRLDGYGIDWAVRHWSW